MRRHGEKTDTPAAWSPPSDASGDADLISRITRRTAELLRRAAPLCRPPSPQIRFDLRGQTAGQALWNGRGSTTLRFNLAFARAHGEAYIRETVTHEVAHLVTMARHGRVRPHGPEWREVMRYLGVAEPRRCHDYHLPEAEARRQRLWPYVCACRRHELSTTRHNRVQRRAARYHCRHCGTRLRAATAPDPATP